MPASWTATADRSNGYVVGSTVWNQLLGASGNVQYLYENYGRGRIAYSAVEGTMTGTTATDLVALTGLSIGAGDPFRLKFAARKTAGAASNASFLVKVNSTTVFDIGKIVTSNTNQAESGIVVIDFWPGETNYQTAVIATAIFYTAAGAVTTSVFSGAYALDAVMPAATVTSITIRGRADTSVTAAVKNVLVERI